MIGIGCDGDTLMYCVEPVGKAVSYRPLLRFYYTPDETTVVEKGSFHVRFYRADS